MAQGSFYKAEDDNNIVTHDGGSNHNALIMCKQVKSMQGMLVPKTISLLHAMFYH